MRRITRITQKTVEKPTDHTPDHTRITRITQVIRILPTLAQNMANLCHKPFANKTGVFCRVPVPEYCAGGQPLRNPATQNATGTFHNNKWPHLYYMETARLGVLLTEQILQHFFFGGAAHVNGRS